MLIDISGPAIHCTSGIIVVLDAPSDGNPRAISPSPGARRATTCGSQPTGACRQPAPASWATRHRAASRQPPRKCSCCKGPQSSNLRVVRGHEYKVKSTRSIEKKKKSESAVAIRPTSCRQRAQYLHMQGNKPFEAAYTWKALYVQRLITRNKTHHDTPWLAIAHKHEV